MATVGPGKQAGLAADALGQTLGPVTDAAAAVEITQQNLVAGQATGDVLKVARDVAPSLMLSHAPLLSEVGTGWALLLTVAVVEHWVVTLVPPGTRVLTLWGLGATGDGGEQDTHPTVARQLIKTGLPAGLAVPTVTELLAAVEATVELVATDQRALVFRAHTAQLATFVSATGAFFEAALLTSKNQSIFILDDCTGNILGLRAAFAFDGGGERAGTAASLMAQLLTDVDGLAGAAGQRLAAGLATGGDGVGAAAAFGVAQLQELGQGRLPTGAAPY